MRMPAVILCFAFEEVSLGHATFSPSFARRRHPVLRLRGAGEALGEGTNGKLNLQGLARHSSPHHEWKDVLPKALPKQGQGLDVSGDGGVMLEILKHGNHTSVRDCGGQCPSSEAYVYIHYLSMIISEDGSMQVLNDSKACGKPVRLVLDERGLAIDETLGTKAWSYALLNMSRGDIAVMFCLIVVRVCVSDDGVVCDCAYVCVCVCVCVCVYVRLGRMGFST
jgi:hypothetical protein